MKRDRSISVCLLILLAFLAFSVHYREREPATETFSTDSVTKEEITDELVIALFIKDITDELTGFYSGYYSGEIAVYHYEVTVLDIAKKEPGLISVRFGATPQIGAHNPLGYDELVYQVDLNILARGNRNSGKLETGIPDAGNQLNSAYVL